MVKQLKPDEAFNKLGLSVIPTDTSSKKPLVFWGEFQDRKPTIEELQQWNQQHKGCAWAAITGKVSNTIVLDFDQPEGPDTMKKLGLDPHVQTPNGGYHAYVEHPGFLVHTLNGKSKAELGKLYPGMDIKGDGGYALFYSPNPDRPYTKLRDLDLIKWDTLPADLRTYLEGSKDKPELQQGEPPLASQEHFSGSDRPASCLLLSQALEKVYRGEGRNNAGFELACQLRDNRYTKDEAMPVMRDFQDTCPETNTKGQAEPYTVEEIEATIKQAYDKSPREPWGTVIVDSKTSPSVDPLKFPDHVITGLIGEFADLYSSHLEAPREALFMAGLTCLGTEVCGYVTLDTEIPVPPRLYTAILGKTAETRKSTAIKAAVDFFDSPSLHVCNGVGSAEGFGPIVSSIRRSESSRMVNLLLYQDELKQLTQKMKGENSALSPCICSLYEGTRYESSTKNKHTLIEHLNLSILGASTIETYESMFDSAMRDIGLINRLWITPVEGERKFPIPKRIDEDVRKSLKEKLSKRISEVKTGDPKILEITTDAYELYEDWYRNQLEKSLYANRLESYALRLMCLQAVNNSRGGVDEDIVRMVIDMCNWQLRVRKHYAPIDAENTTAKLEQAIMKQLERHKIRTEGRLMKDVNASRYGDFFFYQALGNKIKSGEAIRIRDKTYALPKVGRNCGRDVTAS